MPLAARQSVVPRWVPVVIALALLLAGAILEVAWGQTAPPPGAPTLTPDERAFTERNPERWQRMSPEEQQRALERYRHWRAPGAPGHGAARAAPGRRRPPDSARRRGRRGRARDDRPRPAAADLRPAPGRRRARRGDGAGGLARAPARPRAPRRHRHRARAGRAAHAHDVGGRASRAIPAPRRPE